MVCAKRIECSETSGVNEIRRILDSMIWFQRIVTKKQTIIVTGHEICLYLRRSVLRNRNAKPEVGGMGKSGGWLAVGGGGVVILREDGSSD